MLSKKSLCYLLFAITQSAFVFSQSLPTKKKYCKNAAVVSAHSIASAVGVSILKKGGNAFDAAIAVQFTLAVVYPNAGNLGGGGFLVAHRNNSENISIDFREKAPIRASKNMYLNEKGEAQLNLSQEGTLASAVPGTVAGIMSTYQYATLPFETLIQPAIELAKNGFVISAQQAILFNEHKQLFIKLNNYPIPFVKKSDWRAGDTLIQNDLANTLLRIRDTKGKDFYEGKTAKLLIETMQKTNGIIVLEDLKNYQIKSRKTLEFNYKDFKIITMSLPSSGGIILEQMMKMVEHRNINKYKFQSKESIQLMVEVERRAFADRAEYLGDPDFVQVPIEKLVSEKYLSKRMDNYFPGKAGNSENIKAGSIKESEETTHISILDSYGNAVSITTTLNDNFGNKIVVNGAGFILNNEMDDFSIKPGTANLYGAVGNDKNEIAPEKRMLSSMTPTIVLKNNQPFIILGTPGGTTIPTSVFQTLINIIEFKKDPENAVNSAKFHHQWLPDVIYLEENFNQNRINQLHKIGYQVKKRSAIGRTELIIIKKNKIIAVADKRGDDAADGY